MLQLKEYNFKNGREQPVPHSYSILSVCLGKEKKKSHSVSLPFYLNVLEVLLHSSKLWFFTSHFTEYAADFIENKRFGLSETVGDENFLKHISDIRHNCHEDHASFYTCKIIPGLK